MDLQLTVHQLRRKLQWLRVGLAVTKLIVKKVTYALEAGFLFMNANNLGNSLVVLS